jgi:hypothetical protein
MWCTYLRNINFGSVYHKFDIPRKIIKRVVHDVLCSLSCIKHLVHKLQKYLHPISAKENIQRMMHAEQSETLLSMKCMGT